MKFMLVHREIAAGYLSMVDAIQAFDAKELDLQCSPRICAPGLHWASESGDRYLQRTSHLSQSQTSFSSLSTKVEQLIFGRAF
jgi:hypothetical protein